MNIQITNNYVTKPGSKIQVELLEDIVREHISNREYGIGQLEYLETQVNAQTKLLVKIIETIKPTNEQLTEWFGEFGQVHRKWS
jgi:hypothetical protein